MITFLHLLLEVLDTNMIYHFFHSGVITKQYSISALFYSICAIMTSFWVFSLIMSASKEPYFTKVSWIRIFIECIWFIFPALITIFSVLFINYGKKYRNDEANNYRQYKNNFYFVIFSIYFLFLIFCFVCFLFFCIEIIEKKIYLEKNLWNLGSVVRRLALVFSIIISWQFLAMTGLFFLYCFNKIRAKKGKEPLNIVLKFKNNKS